MTRCRGEQPITAVWLGAGGWSDVKQLCETAATVGGVPAALLYVQDNQINLRIPYNVPTEGMTGGDETQVL